MSSVFDFAAINRRLQEIAKRPEDAPRHAALVCIGCGDGGWETFGTGHMDPHFRVCTVCGNPEGLPCP